VAWWSWPVSQVAYWAEAGRAFGPAEIMPIAAQHDWSFAGPPLLPAGELARPPAAAPGQPPAGVSASRAGGS
jgi:hypothetical protein